MFSKFGIAIIAGILAIDITAIGVIVTIVDGVTGVTHTATTVSYRESTSAADTGSGTIIITIITNSASLLGGGSELVAKLEMALTPSQFITRERRSAPAGTSEPAGAHLDQRIT